MNGKDFFSDYEFKEQIITDYTGGNDMYLSSNDGDIYSCNREIKSDSGSGEFYVEVINFSSDIKYKLFLPKDYRITWVPGFDVFENYIYLSIDNGVALYKRENGNYNFIKLIKLDLSLKSIKRINNFLFLYEVGLGWFIMKRETQTAIYKIDLNTYEVVTQKFLQNPSGMALSTFTPNKNIDINEKYIAVADFDGYRIRIFDHDFNLLTVIKRTPKDWLLMGDKIKNRLLKKADEFIDAGKIKPTFPYIDSVRLNNSYISKIHFTGTDILNVYWLEPNGKSFGDKCAYFDEYRILPNNTYKLISKDLKSEREKPEDKFSFEKLYVRKNLVFDDVFMFARPFSIDLKIEIGNTFESIKKKMMNIYWRTT